MHKREWTYCFVCLWHFQRWADQELPELIKEWNRWCVLTCCHYWEVVRAAGRVKVEKVSPYCSVPGLGFAWPLSISPIPAFWLITNCSVPLHISWHNRLTPLKLQAKIHFHFWVSLYFVMKIRFVIHRSALIKCRWRDCGLFSVT